MIASIKRTRGGKVAAICQVCARQAAPTLPDSSGRPDLWAMPRGWSEAPFPSAYAHRDGSTGSRYTCPACNAQLRAGAALRLRSGHEFTRLVA